jgi:hypothetical protein
VTVVRRGHEPPECDGQHVRLRTVYGEVAREQVLQLTRVQSRELGRLRELDQVAAHEPVDNTSQLRKRVCLGDCGDVHTVVQVQLRL